MTSKSIVGADISHFLRNELAKIRKRRRLPGEWPGEENIEKLIQQADGLFIYAATICRFIGDKRSNPSENLQLVLNEYATAVNINRTPTEYLDTMYTQIVQYAIDGNETTRKYFRQVIGATVILNDSMISSALAGLLRISKWVVDEILECLSAVMDHPGTRRFEFYIHPFVTSYWIL